MDIHPGPDAQPAASRNDERLLIARAQRGDDAALSQLYRTHVQAVYRYILLRVGDPQLAEDLVAEVFLKALEALPGYQYRGRPFAAWLFRIAHARVVDHFRQAARRPQAQLEDTLPSAEPDPSAVVDLRSSLGELLGAVATLTDDQRMVIQYRFIEEWSLEQTAQVMGKSVNAVKALQHRALRSLARRLSND